MSLGSSRWTGYEGSSELANTQADTGSLSSHELQGWAKSPSFTTSSRRLPPDTLTRALTTALTR